MSISFEDWQEDNEEGLLESFRILTAEKYAHKVAEAIDPDCKRWRDEVGTLTEGDLDEYLDTGVGQDAFNQYCWEQYENRVEDWSRRGDAEMDARVDWKLEGNQ